MGECVSQISLKRGNCIRLDPHVVFIARQARSQNFAQEGATSEKNRILLLKSNSI